MKVTNCIFCGNSATNRGGALAFQSTVCYLTLSQCTVSNNTAGSGGGIHANHDVSIPLASPIA